MKIIMSGLYWTEIGLKSMNYVLKWMNSALKLMNSALKMLNSVLKMMNSVLQMMNFVGELLTADGTFKSHKDLRSYFEAQGTDLTGKAKTDHFVFQMMDFVFQMMEFSFK